MEVPPVLGPSMAAGASLASRFRTSEIGGSIGKLSGSVVPSFFIVARTSRPTRSLIVTAAISPLMPWPTNISATIVADVKRFSPQINTDEAFGTHKPWLNTMGCPLPQSL